MGGRQPVLKVSLIGGRESRVVLDEQGVLGVAAFGAVGEIVASGLDDRVRTIRIDDERLVVGDPGLVIEP